MATGNTTRNWLGTDEPTTIAVRLAGIATGSGVSLLAEERPSTGTPGQKFDAQVPVFQVVVLGSEDGTVGFQSGSDAPDNARSVVSRPDPTFEFELLPERELGLTVQVAGEEGQVTVQPGAAQFLGCEYFESTQTERTLLQVTSGRSSHSNPLHSAEVSRHEYIVTHCVVRGQGPASVTGERLVIESQPEPGQSFSNGYEYSALQADSQPTPYGVCFHRQGVAASIDGAVSFEGNMLDNSTSLESFWFVSLSDVPVGPLPADAEPI